MGTPAHVVYRVQLRYGSLHNTGYRLSRSLCTSPQEGDMWKNLAHHLSLEETDVFLQSPQYGPGTDWKA